MSNDETDAVRPLDETTRGHMPQARWMVGGAFRYDRNLLVLLQFLKTYYPPRAVGRVAGVVQGAWSLVHREVLPPVPEVYYRALLEAYARVQVGVVLVFDNPTLPADSLRDEGLHRMVQQLLLAEYNPTGANAVCVASDALAATLREKYPRLTLMCHPHRAIVEPGRRSPEFYEKLEELYHRVVLHPRDAVVPELFGKLQHVERYEAVVNDPLPRNYASRRELLGVMAALRLRPWDAALLRAQERLLSLAEAGKPAPACCLTQREEAALYEAGIRSFVVQSVAYRNELTLYYDLLSHLFRTQPELSNRAALIMGAAMAHIRESAVSLPSGLSFFSTVDF